MRRHGGNGARETNDWNAHTQTTIDFTVGTGVFLLTVAWITSTIPQTLGPFKAEQDHPLVANRVTDSFTQHLLIDDENPGALDPVCAEALPDGGSPDKPPGDCDYSSAGPDITIDIDVSYGLNVTFSQNRSVVETTGEPVPTTQSTVTARRAVLLDGDLHELLMRVW